MINNIGRTSSAIRLAAGLSILALYFTQVLTGTFGTVLFSLAGVLLISGIFKSCPLTYVTQKLQKRKED